MRYTQLDIKPVRLFGHVDPPDQHHAAPQVRWDKQKRRRAMRKQRKRPHP